MITILFDIVTGKPVDSAGQARAAADLRIAYQSNPTWRVTFVEADPVAGTTTAVDVSSAATWAAAVDDDFDHSSDPMVRTLSASIDASDAANGNIDVTMDANTATFLAAVTGQDYIRTPNFEVRGLSGAGAVVWYAKFPVLADNTLDPSGGTPPAPAGNYYTKTETNALLEGDRPTVALNPKSAAATVVFTVPTGYWFIPLRGFVQCLTVAADGTGHTGKWTAGGSDITAAEATAHATANDVDAVQFSPVKAYAAGTEIGYAVTVASTHSVHTARLALQGALYKAN